MTSERWPNLFLVGAARAGTTSVYRYLGQHPDIFMSPLKEPDFFSPKANPRTWVEKAYSKESYLALFAGAGRERLFGEASTSYLWFPGTAHAIHARVPHAKILIILREPVDRAYSHYLMDLSDGVERRPFFEIIQDAARRKIPSYADFGLYCDQVKNYVHLFGDQVLVLFYETLFADPRKWLRVTFEFLGVDPDIAHAVDLERHHLYARPRNPVGRALVRAAGNARRILGRPILPGFLQPVARKLVLTSGEKPALDPRARAYLVDLYQGQAACLRALLGVEPPWNSTTTYRG
jgi:Sulfotransferase domain